MTKEEVAGVLDEIGTLLELKGESSFRCQAYHNGARAVEQMEEDLTTVVREGRLGEVRGIGSTLQEKITTLVTTGKLPFLDKLREEVPAGLLQMMRIPGLGPKKIKALHDELGISDLDALRQACEAGTVAKLKGFGAKTQAKILEGIAFLGEVGQRVLFAQAYPLGAALLERLAAMPGVIRSALCGSLRRRRETAKDIDILLSSADPRPIMEAFVKLPEVIQVTGHGDTKSSVVAALGVGQHRVVLNADLRIVSDEQFPYALQHFTGNKDHNKRVRQRAIDRGLTSNEYGLFREDGSNIACTDEAEIYGALGLTWMPPEMREDTGELEIAEAGKVPALLDAKDVRGVFHNHTTYSDGSNTLEEMARAAMALGFEYLGIADHSQSLKVARGLSPAAVRKQLKEIDALNEKLEGFRVFKGTECDILSDGSLDYDEELLRLFDYVVISVHTDFNQPAEEMTARICKALSHPAVTMLGHLTGRLLLRRSGYQVDVDAVLKCAAAHGKMVEINAQPSRLDLDWVHCKRAKALGVPIVINPDAHSTEELGFFVYGVNVARRGWLTAADVFNTRPLAEVTADLERRKAMWK